MTTLDKTLDLSRCRLHFQKGVCLSLSNHLAMHYDLMPRFDPLTQFKFCFLPIYKEGEINTKYLEKFGFISTVFHRKCMSTKHYFLVPFIRISLLFCCFSLSFCFTQMELNDCVPSKDEKNHPRFFNEMCFFGFTLVGARAKKHWMKRTVLLHKMIITCVVMILQIFLLYVFSYTLA